MSDMQIYFTAMQAKSNIYTQGHARCHSIGIMNDDQSHGLSRSNSRQTYQPIKLNQWDEPTPLQQATEFTQNHQLSKTYDIAKHDYDASRLEQSFASLHLAPQFHQQHIPNSKAPDDSMSQQLAHRIQSSNASQVCSNQTVHQPEKGCSSTLDSLPKAPVIPRLNPVQMDPILRPGEQAEKQEQVSYNAKKNQSANSRHSDINPFIERHSQALKLEQRLKSLSSCVNEAVQAANQAGSSGYIELMKKERTKDAITLLACHSALPQMVSNDDTMRNGGISIVSSMNENDMMVTAPLRNMVEEICCSVQERNEKIVLEILERSGSAVVICKLRISEIQLPKLMVMVAQGYPYKGSMTYRFERPPFGWIGVLADIRLQFQHKIETEQHQSFGLAMLLETWAHTAGALMYGWGQSGLDWD